MGLFDIFKRKEKAKSLNQTPTMEPNIQKKAPAAIPESEKRFYQPDEYYTNKTHEGTAFEQTVITFDERKKTCIPSNTGLYVAEILLLEYCSYGTYPSPKTGYPGFWWFEYGIRNVGAALSSLEERGYIKYGCVANSLKGLNVSELKTLLKQHGLPTTGKKVDLIEKAAANIDEADLISFGLSPKYELTELGQAELQENMYVPYMHKYPHRTNDSAGIDLAFNVWTINKLLGHNDKSNWKEIVGQEEARVFGKMKKNHDALMEQLSEFDPALFNELKSQDKQLELIQQAETRYEGDTDALIELWENIWKSKGLLFEGSRWHFRLPDLYIKAKRYDDALAFCKMIKSKKPTYADKAENYIAKIEAKKAKA